MRTGDFRGGSMFAITLVIGIARLERDGHEIREHGKPRGESRCGRLSAQHRRERVTWTTGGACSDQIRVSLMKFVSGTLQWSQIIAQRARNRFFQRSFERFLPLFQ